MTKLIKDLAVKLSKENEYTSAEYAGTILTRVKKSLLNGRYYTGVTSVSRSGMSRTIEIKYIYKNELRSVPDFIYKIAGCDKNKRINGCGMDMLFSAQYNLFQTLTSKRMRYQDKMTRYNSL